MESSQEAVKIEDYARQRLFAKYKGKTIRTEEIDKEILLILQEREAQGLASVEEREDEDQDSEEEDELTIKNPTGVNKAQPKYDIQSKAAEEEDSDEEQTIKVGGPKQTQKQQESAKQEEEDEDEATVKPRALPARLSVQPQKLVISASTNKDLKTIRYAVGNVTNKIREAQTQEEIRLPKVDSDEHKLILYKGKRIIHSEIYKQYKLEPEYYSNLDLLIKRACEKQTVIITDEESFEAQDTVEKVTKFLRKYSRYFKDVVKISQLAKGGESVVYNLEHSLPDELVIKCPILTKEQQQRELPIAFNDIMYESQTINMNPHQGHIVNNVEEIILYNATKGVITNYCVIVEKAKYEFKQLLAIWKDDKKAMLQQDFYHPDKVTFYFMQTLMAMNYMHSRNIYFGDMKEANLLIFRNQEVKIGDLGVSIKMQPLDLSHLKKDENFLDEFKLEDDLDLKDLDLDFLKGLGSELEEELKAAGLGQEANQKKEPEYEENPIYQVKGLTPGGYALDSIMKDVANKKKVKREALLLNDRHAVTFTFQKILTSLQSIDKQMMDADYQYVQIYKDLSNTEVSLVDCMRKWAFILDNDFDFKNRLCEQLRKEYKFLGLPKVHLFLHQKLIKNFYMKKQIVYMKDVSEDNTVDPKTDDFFVDPIKELISDEFYTGSQEQPKDSNRAKLPHFNDRIEEFPYVFKVAHFPNPFGEKSKIKEKITVNEWNRLKDQRKQEIIDFYWALRAAKVSIDNIQKDFEHVMDRKLLIKQKEKNNKMYDFKEFQIQEIIKKPDMCLKNVKMLDAISGPNHEGLQIELQYKLCHEICKALENEFTKRAKTKEGDQKEKDLKKVQECQELSTKFLRRVEQYFILEFNENKDTGFKEQQIRKLREQIKKFYPVYKDNPKLRFTIQFAFYSYFMYKDSRVNQPRPSDVEGYKKAIDDQIVFIEDALPIFKELMGENVNLQNTLFFKQAQSMMDGKYYSLFNEKIPRGANDNYYRLYLTKKSLESFHDYIYSYKLKLEQEQANRKVPGAPQELEYEIINEIEKKYNDERLQSGFLLFKEYFNRYYKYVPGYGLKNPKISERFAYLDTPEGMEMIPNRVPKYFFQHFRSFLKQINDNSTEDISRKRTHLYSYDEMQPKNTYLNLNYKCLDLEKINISESILSDDIELLLKYQEHKVTLKKLVINFDVNSKIIAMDGVYWNSNLQEEVKTDHYKEFKSSEIVFEFPAHVYPISMQIIVGRRLTMRLSNFEYYQIDSDYPDTHYVEKKDRKTLFSKLFRPFCEVILGNFQFYNPLAQDLKSQSYYVKMSRQHHLFNLIRSLTNKLQVVHDYSQIKEQPGALIVYRDQYLLSYDLYKKLEKDLKGGEIAFNWLFSQEKLLNQRRTNWKQYMKDVRNHLVYYWKNLQIGDSFKTGLTQEDDKKGVKAATQEAQIIHTIESLEEAVAKMFDALKNRFIFDNDETNWQITIGYKIGGNSNTLNDFSQMSTLEKQVYIYQMIVLLMDIYERGFTVATINKIEYGQDIFFMEVKYSDINCIPELFAVEDFITILENHFKTQKNDLWNDVVPLIQRHEELEEVLAEWREQFALNFRENLAQAIKKEKLLPQFMRILPMPFHHLFQSELYLFEKEKRIEFPFSEDDQILLHLMLLKAQHKTKTPSNTIRNLKYKTQDQFTPEKIKKIFNELKDKHAADDQWRKMLEFFKEGIFRYHVFDTNPFLLNQWRTEIAILFDESELVQYANYFFYSCYDYYSIQMPILTQQMKDLFSVLSPDKIRETIKIIFQIVMARIQGSLNVNKQPYLDFLTPFFGEEHKTQLDEIIQKIEDYIKSEYEDNDYVDYEKEFMEFNDCSEAIRRLKDNRPWRDLGVKYPKDLDAQMKEEFNKTVDEQFNKIVSEVKEGKRIWTELVKMEKEQLDPKKLHIKGEYRALTEELAKHNNKDVGNIFAKMLILKGSRTKHRVFGQYRIAKKYIGPYERYLASRSDEEGKKWLDTIHNIMNKAYQMTLVEQVDHQYLPKFREIFNRLDDGHRITNYDDFEIVARKTSDYFQWLQEQTETVVDFDDHFIKKGTTFLSSSSGLASQTNLSVTKQVSSFKSQATLAQLIQKPGFDKPRDSLENKYIDIGHWPIVAAVNLYVDQDLRVVHMGAQYKLPNEKFAEQRKTSLTFDGFKYEIAELGNLRKVHIEFEGKEVLAEVSAKGTKITDFVFLIGEDNHLTAQIKIGEDLELQKEDIFEDKEELLSRNVLSFSGFYSESLGLINLNQYYFFTTEEQDPEEAHVYYECDSDDEDYFNPEEDM